jgi:hypothetical protein
MVLGFYVPISIFAILWLASGPKEVRYQLDRARHERAVCACALDALVPVESRTVKPIAEVDAADKVVSALGFPR